MSRADLYIVILILAGGIFSLLFSFLLLLSRREFSLFSIVHISTFFLYGICVISGTYYRPGTEYLTPRLLYVDYPIMYLLGPLFFIYMNSLLSPHFKLKGRHLLFLLPPLVVASAFIPFYAMPSSRKLLLFPLDVCPDGYLRPLCRLTERFMLPWCFFCTGLSLIGVRNVWGDKSPQIKGLLLYLILCLCVLMELSVADILDFTAMYRTGDLLANLLDIALAFITLTQPDFFRKIRKAVSDHRYRLTPVEQRDAKLIMARVDDLMNLDEIYRDCALTLSGIGALLEIQGPSLSRIINMSTGKNFRNYINEFRLNAAKRELLQGRDSVGIIAVKVGFQSRSTFNRIFKEKEGLNPSEFREKWQEKGK